MTDLLKKVICCITGEKDEEFESIAIATDKMLTFEKYKYFNRGSTRGNISRACQKGTMCCDRYWKYTEPDTFKFIKEEWKQYRDTVYYFSEKYPFYYNSNKKSQVWGDKSGNIRIYYNKTKQETMFFIYALWITFNGEVPLSHYIQFKDDKKEPLLENINMYPFECSICYTPFENIDRRKKYCSEKCKNRSGHNRNKCNTRISLKHCVAEIIHPWRVKFRLNIDEVMEVPGIQTRTCQYCGMENLELCSDDNFSSNKLSIDAKNPGDHSLENLICCCWLCNRMKNDYPYEDFIKLISFLKGENEVLDLSMIEYTKKDDSVKKEYSKSPWYTLNVENPELFKERGSSKKLFRELYEKQNGMDAIYGIFPLISLGPRNLLNVSVDKIDPKDNTKWQHIPAFMNYAKSIDSTEKLKEEFRKRNWLQNNNGVKLPENYMEDSYFINKLIQDKRQGRGHNGMKRSEETKKNISESKKGKMLGKNNHNSRQVTSTDLKNGHKRTWDSISDAQRELKLSKAATSGICACAKGKLSQSYGYKWEYLTLLDKD